jgi:MFS family permease
MARRVPRNVYLLGLLSFFNDVTADMITPLLPAYLGLLGLGAGFLGVMEGFANFFSYITMLFSGWYADRLGKSKMITMTGYYLSSFIRPFISIPLSPVIFAARLMDRIGKGIRTAPRDHLITASIQQKRWGEAFGIQRAMDHGGALVGTGIAAWLLARYSIKFSYLFLIASIPAIVSVLIIPSKVQDYPHAPKEKFGRLSWKVLTPTIKLYVLVIFVSAFSTPSQLFLILRMTNLGMPTYQGPLAWMLLTLFSLVAAYLGGSLGDKWSRRRVMGLGWTLFFVVYLGFAFNTQIHWSWILIAAFGFQNGLVEASERAYMAGIAAPEMRATALGWYYFAYGIGLLPASLIFGFVWKLWSPEAAFLLDAILTLLAVFLLLLLPSDRPEREKLKKLAEQHGATED